ncbi:UPF0158 family protein [Gemmatimonadota bacterium]
MIENTSPEGERVPVLQRPVSDFPLSVRSANILRREKVTSIEELISHTEEEVRKWSDRGMEAFTELADLVRELGLRFGMKRKTVEITEIAEAMGIDRVTNEWYLDRDTGEVVIVPEEIFFELETDTFDPDEMTDWDRENQALARAMDDDPDRYLWIPRTEASETYELMLHFADSREDENLRRLLEVALDGKGAFGRFRHVLAEYPEERDEWFRIKDRATEKMARDWLSSLDIEAE